ncbi:MAG: AAA family ATPase [bacterium]
MWANVIGQTRVKKVIRQTLESGMIPSAYLFMGTEGIGKDAMAVELAKTLNCTGDTAKRHEACDVCSNCIAIGSLTSPLLTFVTALAKDSDKVTKRDDDDDDAVAKIDIIREQFAAKAADPYFNIQIPKAINIGINQIRDLRIFLSRSMTMGTKRVVIISEADTMRKEAQNAFLKSLEEPRQNTLIILTSSNPSRLYATILSRCQDLRFDLLPPTEISEALITRDSVDPKQAEFLSRLSGGSFSAARNLISDDIGLLRTQAVELLRSGLDKSLPRTKAVEELNKIAPRGGGFLEKRQAVEQILQLLTLWLRDALAIVTGSEEYLFNSDQLETLKRFVSGFGTPAGIVKALHVIEQTEIHIKLQLQLRPVILQMAMEIEEALTNPNPA